MWWAFIVAGILILLAVVFIIKFFIDSKKAKKKAENTAENTVVVTVEADKKSAFDANAKRDLIIAFVCMALCEIFILIGNKI